MYVCYDGTPTQIHITNWVFLYEACWAFYIVCTVLVNYTDKQYAAHCFSPF